MARVHSQRAKVVKKMDFPRKVINKIWRKLSTILAGFLLITLVKKIWIKK